MTWKIRTCDKCGSDKQGKMQMVILKDELWIELVGKEKRRDVWCLSCIQKALCRPLSFEDLKDCPVTDSMMVGALIASQTVDFQIPKDLLERV